MHSITNTNMGDFKELAEKKVNTDDGSPESLSERLQRYLKNTNDAYKYVDTVGGIMPGSPTTALDVLNPTMAMGLPFKIAKAAEMASEVPSVLKAAEEIGVVAPKVLGAVEEASSAIPKVIKLDKIRNILRSPQSAQVMRAKQAAEGADVFKQAELANKLSRIEEVPVMVNNEMMMPIRSYRPTFRKLSKP